MYRSRSAADDLAESIKATGKTPLGFASRDPCESIYSKFMTTFKTVLGAGDAVPMKSASYNNVGVTLSPNMPGFAAQSHQNPSLFAKTDANVLQELDATTLEPIRVTTYRAIEPKAQGPLSAAHPCRDHKTDEIFNYTLDFGKNPKYTVFSVSSKGNRVLATIKDSKGAYLHSLCLTQRYVILCVWQADYTLGGMGMIYHGNLLDGIERKWDPSRRTKFYVINRAEGGVKKVFESEQAFFCFHTANAWDEGDDVVLNLVQYPNHDILWNVLLEHLRSDSPTALGPDALSKNFMTRYRLANVSTVSTSSPSIAVIDKSYDDDARMNIELPTWNTQYDLRPTRFIYGINTGGKSSFVENIIKLDLKTGAHKVFGIPYCTPSEAIFVPRPNALAEDDGVLLTVLLDGIQGRSMLLIVDAQTMTEVARATMDQGKVVPFGFHGAYVG